jgi:hypothetical protein
MLIATFNETTGWAGKTITFEDGSFTLEGLGPVSPKNIMEYGRRGHLTWASDGTRAWVGAKVLSPAGPPPQQTEPNATSTTSADEEARQPATGADALAQVEDGRVITIATFGPATAFAGKKITREADAFIPEGQGPISAAEIIVRDSQDQPADGAPAKVGSKVNAAPGQPERAAVSATPASGEAVLRQKEAAPTPTATIARDTKPKSANAYEEIPDEARKVYEAHGASRQVDFTIVGEGDQCLIALPTSCVIVKPGMRDGERFTTFLYRQMTGVEITASARLGVLEVTTASYPGNCIVGKATTFSGPETAEKIAELRRRAQASKQAAQAAVAEPDLADHLVQSSTKSGPKRAQTAPWVPTSPRPSKPRGSIPMAVAIAGMVVAAIAFGVLFVKYPGLGISGCGGSDWSVVTSYSGGGSGIHYDGSGVFTLRGGKQQLKVTITNAGSLASVTGFIVNETTGMNAGSFVSAGSSGNEDTYNLGAGDYSITSQSGDCAYTVTLSEAP